MDARHGNSSTLDWECCQAFVMMGYKERHGSVGEDTPIRAGHETKTLLGGPALLQQVYTGFFCFTSKKIILFLLKGKVHTRN